MRPCPQCNGNGRLGRLGSSGYITTGLPCPAEHVELIRCPYDPRLCMKHEGHNEPFFADPASVKWLCQTHNCYTVQPSLRCPVGLLQLAAGAAPPDLCDMVPADEPVTYELWTEVLEEKGVDA